MRTTRSDRPPAMAVAADICVFTNDRVTVETIG
jgi:ATP-dependent protease HslVU (ClpYQ) peptidase subunit